MKAAVKKGLGFGLTSGIITTLGMMVGLESGTKSKMVVIGGVLVIAIADAMSDALGIHISEEVEAHHPPKEVWHATIVTFLAKFFFALTFVIPILIFNITTAVIISVVWGLSILTIFSWVMAKKQQASPFEVTGEHLLIAALVVFITHYLGDWIRTWSNI